jgi:hypothetical protein
VAQRLRAGGWGGDGGWWFNPEESERALRWWDALHLAMNRERGTVRARDRGQAVDGRCRRTPDMFG